MPDPKTVKLGKYQLTARADAPDFRDFVYEPPLIQLKARLPVSGKLNVRDQGTEGTCTGFGLAASIDLLLKQTGRRVTVSPRMLYEMAKRYDEWGGYGYEGSSCRGAIKGWYNMGVCRESLYPYTVNKRGRFSVAAAKDARNNTVGAYYRLGARISDYHAALNETGVVYCSANVHDGWSKPDKKTGEIEWKKKAKGGHAFAIVGYDEHGFWIQNSWGDDWGREGTALWSYEDWHTNIQDAWVFRLALPTPQVWHLPPAGGSETANARKCKKPTRSEIAGHFVHIDDGHFHDNGAYWSNLDDVRETARLVAASDKYDHVLFYAHGGLNSPDASACRIAALKETFKQNRIYPFHLMYDTGILEELKDMVVGRREAAAERAGGVLDWLDRLVEKATRVPGRALWREMKSGARLPFEADRAGTATLAEFVTALSETNRPKQIHLAGHSTGMILVSHLAQRLAVLAPELCVDTASLMAPAGTVELFTNHLQPLLKAHAPQFRIAELAIYNLSDKLEQDDEVTKAYNKSLLYLVSNAYEEEPPARVLGMEKFSKSVERRKVPRLDIYYSEGKTSGARITASETHGGFDNDPLTMNHILRRVLGKAPATPFTKENLEY